MVADSGCQPLFYVELRNVVSRMNKISHFWEWNKCSIYSIAFLFFMLILEPAFWGRIFIYYKTLLNIYLLSCNNPAIDCYLCHWKLEYFYLWGLTSCLTSCIICFSRYGILNSTLARNQNPFKYILLIFCSLY